MEDRERVELRDGGRRRPFQYSLRSMFVVTTAAAIGLSLLVAGPYWLVMLVLVIAALAIPMVLTVVLVYGRGAIRTFSIGALFPAGALASTLTPGLLSLFSLGEGGWPGRLELEDRLFLAIFFAVACAVTVGFGFLAVWVRRMVETRSGQHGQGSDPHTGAPIAPEETRPGAGTGPE